MKFKAAKVDENVTMIMRDENVVAGSIARIGDHWHVEIMWSGPTGDIKYDAPSLPAALAFVDGVEKATEAMTASLKAASH